MAKKKVSKAEVAEQEAWMNELSVKVANLKTDNEIWMKENEGIAEEREGLMEKFEKVKAEVAMLDEQHEKLIEDKENTRARISSLADELKKVDVALDKGSKELEKVSADIAEKTAILEELNSNESDRVKELLGREVAVKKAYTNVAAYEEEITAREGVLVKREALLNLKAKAE